MQCTACIVYRTMNGYASMRAMQIMYVHVQSSIMMWCDEWYKLLENRARFDRHVYWEDETVKFSYQRPYLFPLSRLTEPDMIKLWDQLNFYC